MIYTKKRGQSLAALTSIKEKVMIGLSELRRYKMLVSHNQLSNKDVGLIIDEAIKLNISKRRVLDNYNNARKEIASLSKQVKNLKRVEKSLEKAEKKIQYLTEKLKEDL